MFVRTFGRSDVTIDHVKALCTRRGWLTGRQRWSRLAERRLRELYPDLSTADVAQRLGRSVSAIYGRARKLGLTKSAAYLASPAACRLRRGDNVGAACRFLKGHVPANKGKPMPFHPNSAAMRFKKGRVAENLKPLGTERISKDGYVEIKVDQVNPYTGAQGRFVLKHRHLWEGIHGPVPKDMALKAIDGNRQNTDPSNWELVSRGLLPRLNGKSGRRYDTAPAEIKPSIMAIAKLEAAAARRREAAR